MTITYFRPPRHILTALCSDANTDPSLEVEESPFPPSPPRSDRSKRSNYAARLKQIPGFEAYSYHSTSSSYEDGTANINGHIVLYGSGYDDGIAGGRGHSAPYKSDANRGNHHRNSHHFRSTLNRGSVAVNNRPPVLSQLKTITSKREALMRLESQIKIIHRKLASRRADWQNEIYSGFSVINQDSFNIETLNRVWTKLQDKLFEISEEMTTLEEELHLLEGERTRTHWTVKGAEGDLYASLTGGARPGDSDASQEDRLLTNLAHKSIDARPEHELLVEIASTYMPPIFDAHDGRILKHPAMSRFVNQEEEELSNGVGLDHALEPRPLSPIQQLKLRNAGVDDSEKAGPNDKRMLEAIKRELTFQNETSGIGLCFPSTNAAILRGNIDAAGRSTLLAPTAAFVKVRKGDFTSLLGYDIDQLNWRLTSVGNPQQGEPHTVAQKLANIHVESIHTGQLISLWGRQMSQNSALEASRTYIYGEHSLESLLKRNQTELGSKVSADVVKLTVPLLRLVEDVRKLKVPLESTDIYNQPLIAVSHNFDENYRPPSSSVGANASVNANRSGTLFILGKIHMLML